MILDSSLEFADNLSVAAAAGTAVLANAIDLGAAGERIATGQPAMYLVINVATAFASAGAATVQFRLVSDSTDPASTDGTETRHWQSENFAYTRLTAGKKLIIPLPSGDATPYERYLQLQVVTGTATTTAGAINAFLTAFPDDWKAMAEAAS